MGKQDSREVHSGRSTNSKATLIKYPRSKIVESYFTRLHVNVGPMVIPLGLEELFEIKLDDIKTFLTDQHPQDDILIKLLRFSG